MSRYIIIVLWVLLLLYAVVLFGMVKDCLFLRKDEHEVRKNKDLTSAEKNRVLQSIRSQRASFFITLAVFGVVLAGLITATIVLLLH